MKKNNRGLHPLDNANFSVWFCILFGVLLLSILNVLVITKNYYTDVIGISFLILYLIAAVAALILRKFRHQSVAIHKRENIAMSMVMADTVKHIHLPFVISDEGGKIIWYNDGFSAMIGNSGTLFGAQLNEFCQLSPEELVKTNPLTIDFSPEFGAQDSYVIDIGTKRYTVNSYPIRVVGKNYFMSVFADKTDYFRLEQKQKKSEPVVAYVVIDNLDELAQYVRVSSREAANEAEAVLKNWASSMNAVLREYDRDKYILFFEKQQLDACINGKFDILEQVRNIRLGDSSMPITVSIGISAVGKTFAERESGARSALDMALQRGGDQVALRTESGLAFYGGRTRNMQKRTRVLARVIANQLLSLISSSDNVIIMGHKNPDFDSIGSCVGLARLCMHCGVPTKIVMDKTNKNFLDCSANLLENELYHSMFVEPTAAIDLVGSNTLLLISDANNMSILEAPSVAENIFRFAIIDHHRKTAEFTRSPEISYIDPSASSASELVAEILEQCLPDGSLMKEESTVILSGIMVDTKNFTRSTGIRTFAAALYLRGQGANAEIAHTFFNEDLEDFSAEAKFGSNVTIYRDTIAITTSTGTDNETGDRVAASKAADKLLTVKNVAASFALVQIGNTIHISARSAGAVNVQLILEKVGGGGHFHSAGALMPGKNMKETLVKLKGAIDEYLDTL